MKKLSLIILILFCFSCSVQKYKSENIYLKLQLRYDSLYFENKIDLINLQEIKSGSHQTYYLFKQNKVFKK